MMMEENVLMQNVAYLKLFGSVELSSDENIDLAFFSQLFANKLRHD